MENKNKYVKMGFSTILWGVIAMLACCVPCSAATVVVGDTLNLSSPILSDWLDVYGTLNMYPGAYVDWGIYAYDGSTVNIYAGSIIDVYSYIQVDNGANVTVYGTAFQLDGTDLVPIPDDVTSAGGTLSVTYDNETTADFIFYGSINLVDTAGGEPLEAELWVLPCFINRDRPRPARIWTLLRLPEGIAKDDIDNGQPLRLDPGDIEAANQYAFEWYEDGILRAGIIASFDKAELMTAVPDGEVELKVAGQLITDQDFYGIQTVTIFSWP